MTTKKVTTTREYDAEGRLVKETITTDEQVTAYWPIWNACTCPSSTYCPLHPVKGPVWTIQTGSANYSRSHEVAGL